MSGRAALRLVLLVLGGGLLAGCGGGGGGSGPSEAATTFLATHNARFNDGRTVRWPNLPIRVFTNNIARRDEVTEWTRATGGLVTFTFVGSAASGDITFRFGTGADICGITTVEFLASGQITLADVRVVREVFRGPECINTVTHEVGHAIGFLDHTADGGLMDVAGGSGLITEPVARMFRDLYTMPVGTVVGIGERPRPALRRSNGRYTMTFVHPVRR